MRNPDTLQEVVEERVAAGDGGFTLKLPRTVARCNPYNCSFKVESCKAGATTESLTD